MCIVSCTDSLSLQNENIEAGNEHFVNGSAISSDEENAKVKYNRKLITENVEDLPNSLKFTICLTDQLCKSQCNILIAVVAVL